MVEHGFSARTNETESSGVVTIDGMLRISTRLKPLFVHQRLLHALNGLNGRKSRGQSPVLHVHACLSSAGGKPPTNGGSEGKKGSGSKGCGVNISLTMCYLLIQVKSRRTSLQRRPLLQRLGLPRQQSRASQVESRRRQSPMLLLDMCRRSE